MENNSTTINQQPWVWPTLRIILSLAVGGLGVWFVTRDVNLADVQTAVQQAHWGYIILGAATIVITIILKACRWYLLLMTSAARVPFTTTLRVLSLGIFLNLLLPIARLGEISRIYLLDKQISKAQVLGTLVLEKSIEVIMLTLTLAVVLPLTILPSTINQPGVIAAVAAVMLVVVYLLAYQAPLLLKIGHWMAGYLPGKLGQWLLKFLMGSLEGLTALRGRRSAVSVLILSALSMLTSVLTPYWLLKAFSLPLGIAEATLINAVLTFGSVPSSAPGNIGVFEFLVIATLQQVGVTNESVMLSYALIYHLVTYLPVIIMGMAALTQTDWRPWRLLRTSTAQQ